MTERELLQSIYSDGYKFAKAVGFKDVTPLHSEWMRELIFGSEDYTLMAHRGAFKSSVLAVSIALMMIIYPDKNIIFLRKADVDVSEMIRMVAKMLHSEVIGDICQILHHCRLEVTEEAQDKISTNLWMTPRGTPQLQGLGLRSSITGKHAEIVITDDICNVSDRISRAERERTKLQYQELQNIRNRGGRIINLGTKWHQEDVFSMMPNIHIYDCYSTGLISEEALAKIRASMTASLFACNYELRIIAGDDVIFQNPKFTDDVSKIEQGDSHIDASYGGEDYTAFTIATKIGEDYFVYGKMWHKHIDDVQDEIIALRRKYMCGRVYCEDNGDKGYLCRDLRLKGERAVSYHENMNKHLKITTYLKGVWDHLYFVQGTDKEYINQICDYTDASPHDDSADSCASMIRLLWKR